MRRDELAHLFARTTDAKLFFSLAAAFAIAFILISHFSPVLAKDDGPAPSKLAAYKAQRMGMFSLSKLTGAPVVMLGDSLTERALWPEITGCPFIANRGIGGDTSGGVLLRIDNSIQLKPRAVFLMVGINDIASGVPVSVAAENLERIVERLQAAHAQVFLAYVLPVTKSYKVKLNPQVDELNVAIEKLARRPGITEIDLRPKMRDGEGNLRNDLTADGIHLNTEGYRIWRDAIVPFVEAHCTTPAVLSQR